MSTDFLLHNVEQKTWNFMHVTFQHVEKYYTYYTVMAFGGAELGKSPWHMVLGHDFSSKSVAVLLSYLRKLETIYYHVNVNIVNTVIIVYSVLLVTACIFATKKNIKT